jgi:hypothetical protein
MKQRRIAVLSYHQFPKEDWPADEFSDCSVELAGGEVTTLKLAERGSRRSHGLWVREVRKRSETSSRTWLGSNHDWADYTALAVSMLARWSQENFYQYLRQHWDRLAEYGTEPVPDLIQAVHPAGRKLDAQIRAQTETRRRQLALLGALDLQSSPEEPEVARYQQTKLNCKTRLRTSTATSTRLKGSGKKRPHRSRIYRRQTASADCPPNGSIHPQADRLPHRNQQGLTLTRPAEPGRRYPGSATSDLCDRSRPDSRLPSNTLTVCLQHLTQATHDQAVLHCNELNATERMFPGTELKLVYQWAHHRFPEIRRSEGEGKDDRLRRLTAALTLIRRIALTHNSPP